MTQQSRHPGRICIAQCEQKELSATSQSIESCAAELSLELPGGSGPEDSSPAYLHLSDDLAPEQRLEVSDQQFNFRQFRHVKYNPAGQPSRTVSARKSSSTSASVVWENVS